MSTEKPAPTRKPPHRWDAKTASEAGRKGGASKRRPLWEFTRKQKGKKRG